MLKIKESVKTNFLLYSLIFTFSVLVCVVPWFPVYSCLLFVSLSDLRPQCTCITGSCCIFSWTISVATKTAPHFCKQLHRLPLYICMSLSFYTEISLKTGTIEHLCFEPSFSSPWHNMSGYKKTQEVHDLLKHHKDCCASKNNLTVLSSIVRFPNAVLVWVPLRAFAITAMQLIF